MAGNFVSDRSSLGDSRGGVVVWGTGQNVVNTCVFAHRVSQTLKPFTGDLAVPS